jgi:phage antirepressor YoqD-like protein
MQGACAAPIHRGSDLTTPGRSSVIELGMIEAETRKFAKSAAPWGRAAFTKQAQAGRQQMWSEWGRSARAQDTC